MLSVYITLIPLMKSNNLFTRLQHLTANYTTSATIISGCPVVPTPKLEFRQVFRASKVVVQQVFNKKGPTKNTLTKIIDILMRP